MISGYITHNDYARLLKVLDDPDLICPSCSNKLNCSGKWECFNRENYKYIKIRNDRTRFWGQPPSKAGKDSSRAGDSPLAQLDQIDIPIEESNQSQKKKSGLLSEVDF